ncbi:MAG: hypothetical protein IJ403_10725 [Oscillospiraceae bacterium]|nr:hypothetical protein [Oscillospiraceae bacterium]
MRRKMTSEEKRSIIIGIKVKPETRYKIEWIANREATKLSTYLDNWLKDHIETYFKYNHIEWDKLTDEEREIQNTKKKGGL